MNDIYVWVDKIIEHLSKRYVIEFEKFSQSNKFDAMNVIKKSKVMYNNLHKITKEDYYMAARSIYRDYTDQDLEEAWLTGVLNDYEPVTGYVFDNEWKRKQARFAESVIASSNKKREIKTALHLLARQAAQGAITVADAAQREAFDTLGIKEVRWISEHDNKVCDECFERNGKIYLIQEVPPKPHYNCRCRLEAV